MLAERRPGVPLTAVEHTIGRLREVNVADRAEILACRSVIRELSPLSTIMTRTRKREVNVDAPMREALRATVQTTPDERLIYDFFTAQSRSNYGSGKRNREQQTARFKSVQLQQQMSSCLPAFLRGRQALDEGGYAYGDLGDRDDSEGELSEEEMETRAKAIRTVEEVESAVRRVLDGKIDSKFDALLTLLQTLQRENPSGKVVIFSFFKETLRYLSQRLEAQGVSSVLISGDVPSRPESPDQDVRGKRVEQFLKDPTLRVLLSSEVGAEGLDFQTVSNVVVHYNLPWNPMKVEQRIGRVDRFGQTHAKVYTVSFGIAGTIEDRIRDVLFERIEVFRSLIGDLEPIIGDEIEEIEHIMMSPDLSEAEREREIARVSDVVYRRAEEQHRLDEEGVKLFGHDDTFDQDLKLLEKRGRSVEPNEVAEFIESALETAGIRTEPVHTGDRRTRIDAPRKTQEFISRHLPQQKLLNVALLYEKAETPVELNYSNSSAIHYVTLHHPLTVACICARQKAPEAEDQPVAAVRVKASLVPEGRYVFALAKLIDRGAVQGSYSIAGVCVRFDGTVLPAPVADQLIRVAFDHGVDDFDLSIPVDCAALLLETLHETVVGLRGLREAELRQRHDRSHQMRVDSERSQGESKLRDANARIQDPEFSGRQEVYRRMIMSKKAKWEAELHRIKLEFANPTLPGVEFQMFAYGLIGVSA